MDISMHENIAAKENLAPSPSEVSYPELPKLSPLKRQVANRSSIASPPKKQHCAANVDPFGQHSIPASSSAIFRSPPNTGRRRAPPKLAGALTKSPPRASYADKVKGIFSESRPISRTLFPNLKHDVRAEPSVDGVRESVNNDSSGSALTSESELETRLNTANTAIVKSANRTVQRAPPRITLQSPPRETITFSKLNMPQIQEPPSDSTSDEWTGDEEFLPRAVRRQVRVAKQQRRMNEGKANPDLPSPNQVRAAAAKSREVWSLFETSPIKSPKPSRFRPANLIRISYPKPSNDDQIGAADHRSSDADDEADAEVETDVDA